MNRRNFFSMLSGVPFAGALFGNKSDNPDTPLRTYWLANGNICYQTTNLSHHTKDDMIEAMNKHIAKLESQPRIEWISVKERLPEVKPPHDSTRYASRQVIVFGERGVGSAYRLDDWDGKTAWMSPQKCITHWAEMPSGPIKLTPVTLQDGSHILFEEPA